MERDCMIEWCKMRISIKPISYFEEEDNLLFNNVIYGYFNQNSNASAWR